MSFRMKRSYLFGLLYYVLFSLFFIGIGFSQIMWQKNYGGADADFGTSVRQTTDGGYIVVGYTYSFQNNAQVYLIKTDSLGDTLWTKTFGGSGDDRGMSVMQTADGGYIIGGFTNSFGDSYQIYLIKTDTSGDTLWTKTYGGTETDYGYSVQQTPDRGYIVTGGGSFIWGYDPLYLIKTDSLGNMLWAKAYGDTIDAIGKSVQQTTDDGYIIAGSIPLGSSRQVYLVKTDSLGDTLWTKTYGTSWSEGNSVQQTTDGGYIVVGYKDIRIYLVKTDSLGDSLWTRTYGRGARWDVEMAYSVQQTIDGGYIIAGYYNYQDEYTQVYLVKTDSLGDTLWTRTCGMIPYFSKGFSVQQTVDRGYIIAGYTSAFGNNQQVYLIKTDQYGNVSIEENLSSAQMPNIPLIVRPNPFSSFTTIVGYEKNKFLLYDISGRKLGSYFGNKIGVDLPSGVYFIVLENKSSRPVRVVKVR
jgi:hypothetical protein